MKQTLTLVSPKPSEVRPNQVQSEVQHITTEVFTDALKEHNTKQKESGTTEGFLAALKKKADVQEELRTAIEICLKVFESFIDIRSVVEGAIEVGGAYICYKELRLQHEGRVRTT